METIILLLKIGFSALGYLGLHMFEFQSFFSSFFRYCCQAHLANGHQVACIVCDFVSKRVVFLFSAGANIGSSGPYSSSDRPVCGQ